MFFNILLCFGSNYFDSFMLMENNIINTKHTWCQFHQHFMYKKFVRMSFWQLFLRTCNKRKAAKQCLYENLCVKCWWNLHLLNHNLARFTFTQRKMTFGWLLLYFPIQLHLSTLKRNPLMDYRQLIYTSTKWIQLQYLNQQINNVSGE